LNTNNLKICKQTGADLVRADLENLPIRDAVIECAECVAVMGHLENPAKAAKEIRRVISRTGVTFITWNNYNWLRTFFQPEIKLRLLLAARDLICDLLPRSATKLMVQNRFLRHVMHNYGIFRYKGFSYGYIKSVYQEARLRIIFSNWLSDQGIILVEGVRA
jgi:ubiquinone/menaquinone biosynthesis C-methylase UbiE